MNNKSRLTEIDGLRGFAILLVVLFHYYARWSDLYPYKDSFSNVFIAKYGFLGVELFFMISGYVIFMTLDTSKSFAEFLWKRWIRLFPAMLIATFLIMASAPFFIERPAGPPRLVDAIPGLVFIDARWLHNLFRLDISDLEGAFWSLYTEVRFYLLVASLYFFAGRKNTVPFLFCIAIGQFMLEPFGATAIITGGPIGWLTLAIGELLVGKYMAWFLIGVLSYLRSIGDNGKLTTIAAVAAAMLAILSINKGLLATLAGIFFSRSIRISYLVWKAKKFFPLASIRFFWDD